MIIQQFGITLKRVEVEDIEMIRIHRNSNAVRPYMAYKKTISARQQKKWFESINNQDNYYFLILHQNKAVGVINAKQINWHEKYGEGGIFIWDEEYILSTIPALASIILLDLSFEILRFRLSYIRILNTNKRAIAYNKQLGYSKVPYQDKVKNPLYILTNEQYRRSRGRLMKYFPQFQICSELTISGKPSENNHTLINDLLSKNSV